MAQLGFNGGFDATQVQPNAPMELLPPGDYVVQIINSEMKNTKDGSGQYLWLEMDIVDGECTGRKVWDRLNLINNNAQTVEIAQRTLSAICHATGVLNVQDSEQLHFKPMVAKVVVKPGRTVNGTTYDASNEVKGYKPADGGQQNYARPQTGAVSGNQSGYQNQGQFQQQQAQGQYQQQAQQRPAGGATPPWKRK